MPKHFGDQLAVAVEQALAVAWSFGLDRRDLAGALSRRAAETEH
jgi:hypothetical protein